MNGQYDELWYRAGNEKVVVMARKEDTLIESITLFSYIFCSFLFLRPWSLLLIPELLLQGVGDAEAPLEVFLFLNSEDH